MEEPSASSQIVLSLPSALTAQSKIRKYNTETAVWSDFTVDANNAYEYTCCSGTATIVAGKTRLLIPIEIIADTVAESDESFSLVITNPTGGVFPAGTSEIISTHTIINDD